MYFNKCGVKCQASAGAYVTATFAVTLIEWVCFCQKLWLFPQMQTVIIVASGALSRTLLIFKWIQNNNGDEKRHIIIAMARKAGRTTEWLMMNGEWAARRGCWRSEWLLFAFGIDRFISLIKGKNNGTYWNIRMFRQNWHVYLTSTIITLQQLILVCFEFRWVKIRRINNNCKSQLVSILCRIRSIVQTEQNAICSNNKNGNLQWACTCNMSINHMQEKTLLIDEK